MKKKSTKKKYKQAAWNQFSIFIRRRDCVGRDDSGNYYGQCCTCKKIFNFCDLQAGHFLPGRTNHLLFNEKMVHVQCKYCNIMLHGNWPAYYEFMVDKYGLEEVQKMIDERNISIKYTEQDYKEIYEKYKELNKNE